MRYDVVTGEYIYPDGRRDCDNCGDPYTPGDDDSELCADCKDYKPGTCGECPECGSLSPWRCGCDRDDDEDEDDAEHIEPDEDEDEDEDEPTPELLAVIASAFPFRRPELHTPSCTCTDCQTIRRLAAALTKTYRLHAK